MRSRPFHLVLFACAIFGCDGEDKGVLAVDVKTDLVPGVEFAGVRVGLETGAPGTITMNVDARLDDDFGAGQRVAEFDGLATGTHRLMVELVESDGGTVLSRPVVVTFEGGTLGLIVVLTRSCAGVSCPGSSDPAATACLAGHCVAPECSESHPEACGTPECAAASDCPTGAACAAAGCAGGACLLEGDNSRCGATEYCAPETGCAPRPGESDAAMMDGGTDTGPADTGQADADAADVAPDAAPDASCVFSAWGSATELTTLNSSATDRAPYMSGDGLEIFFGSNRGGGPGMADLYRATRAAPDVPFDAPTLVTELSTSGEESDPYLTDDGLTIYYAHEFQTYRASRVAVGMPFGSVELIDLGGDAFGPELSADGSTLYFSSSRAMGGGDTDLYRATRSGSTFVGVEMIAELTTTDFECCPSLDASGALLYSHVTGGSENPSRTLPRGWNLRPSFGLLSGHERHQRRGRLRPPRSARHRLRLPTRPARRLGLVDDRAHLRVSPPLSPPSSTRSDPLPPSAMAPRATNARRAAGCRARCSDPAWAPGR